MEDNGVVGRGPDRYAVWAYWLGFFIMVTPLEADMLFALVRAHERTYAKWFAVCCFLIVAVPFALSIRRRSLVPGRWRNRGALIVTALILAFNLWMVIMTFRQPIPS